MGRRSDGKEGRSFFVEIEYRKLPTQPKVRAIIRRGGVAGRLSSSSVSPRQRKSNRVQTDSLTILCYYYE